MCLFFHVSTWLATIFQSNTEIGVGMKEFADVIKKDTSIDFMGGLSIIWVGLIQSVERPQNS